MVGAMGDLVMSAADALAERAGISAQYEDIWGRIHRTSGITRDTVLAALGFNTVAEASDGAAREAAAARTLEQLDEANWSAPLPPVVVDHRQRRARLTDRARRSIAPETARAGRVRRQRWVDHERIRDSEVADRRATRGTRRRAAPAAAAASRRAARLSPLCMDRSRWRSRACDDDVDRLPAPMLSTR